MSDTKPVELTLVPKDEPANDDNPASLVTNLPMNNDVPPLADLVQQVRAAGMEVQVDDTAANPGTVTELAAVVDQLDKAVQAQEAAKAGTGEDMGKTLADLEPMMLKFLTDNGVNVQPERDAENKRLQGLREAELNLIQGLKDSLSDQQFEALPMSLRFFQHMLQLRSTLMQLVKSGALAGLASEVLVQEIAGLNDYVNHYIAATVMRCVTNGFTWMSEADYTEKVQKPINTILQIKADIFNALNADGDRVGAAVQKAAAAAALKQAQANAAAVAPTDSVPRTAAGDPIQ